MIRKLTFPALAIAMLGGCVTSGYDYRGGNGDYYYGQPQVEYRDAGYDGYGGYGYPGGWSGSIGFGSGYPYGYYGGGYGYGGYYSPWGYPYGPVIIRQRPPYNGHGHDHDRDHDGDHDHDHGHGGDGHHHDGDHAGNGPPPPRRGDDRPPWRDLGNGIRPRLPVGVSRPVPAPPRMVEAPPRPPMPRVVEAPPRPPMPRAGGFQSRDDARPEQDRELRRKTRP